jgi:hypothetical protein
MPHEARKLLKSLGTSASVSIDEGCQTCKAKGHGLESALLAKEMEGIENFVNEVAAIKERKRKSEWTVYEDGPIDKIFYKLIKGTKYHTTFIETQVQASIAEVMAILMDVGSYKQWMNMVSHSEILAQASTFRKLAYIRADLPKPLSNR